MSYQVIKWLDKAKDANINIIVNAEGNVEQITFCYEHDPRPLSSFFNFGTLIHQRAMPHIPGQPHTPPKKPCGK